MYFNFPSEAMLAALRNRAKASLSFALSFHCPLSNVSTVTRFKFVHYANQTRHS
jgi:hypothetical protein